MSERECETGCVCLSGWDVRHHKDCCFYPESLGAMLDAERAKSAKLRAALELIAAPKRADGTYNRCREACEQLARQTLAEIDATADTRGEE